MVETTRGTRTVWIVNEGAHNYSKAERYGRLIPITRGNINPFNPGRMMINTQHKLGIATEDDYILLSGLALLNAVVVAMFLSRFGFVNILQYSDKQGDYRLVKIDGVTLDRLANTLSTPAE